MADKWRLQVLGDFSNDYYSLPGEYDSEIDAWNAAAQKLQKCERNSGSMKIYIVRPNGSRYRFRESDLGFDPIFGEEGVE